MKQIFALGITFLFVVTIVTPMVVGYDNKNLEYEVPYTNSHSYIVNTLSISKNTEINTQNNGLEIQRKH